MRGRGRAAMLRAASPDPPGRARVAGRMEMEHMDRRAFLGWTGVAAGALAAPAVFTSDAQAAPDTAAIERALRGFRALPGDTGYMIRVGRPGTPWETSHRPTARMFAASAVKTFILTRFLKDVEDGRLKESTQYAVDDAIRSISSPVFENLTGKTPARSALEAMIAHSDNTATDIALKHVGAERVRAFVAKAGLTSVKIPTSTRIVFSYLAGAPYGVDVGWEGMERIMQGNLFGAARSPMNNRETMKGSAADFVTFYERALAGRYFRTPEMLTEFRRISSMATALWPVVPENTPAYGKGGSIEWDGFNCFSLPGQMLLGGTIPATFSFTVNWTGKPATFPGVFADYVATIKDALGETARAFG